MCGILGSVNIIINKNHLDFIKHRGPDDFGIEEIDIAENMIVFGHRRLSILDLSEAGHQPMHSECGNFVIVFNGEIYNHLELRKKLTDHKFKGHSDTETIVNYIAKFGIESVRDFNGIFAFGLLNKKANKIYLVRDRYGVKPLYYYFEEKKLLFSSEIRPIKNIIKSKIDETNIATLLSLRYSPSPNTLFDNIYKLTPGHCVEYSLSSQKIVKFSYVKVIDENKSISFDDALNEYERLFENAIKRQLISDVEIGVLLSGGIDSALVSYYSQKFIANKLKTFTIGFSDEHESNELIEAKQTADLIGTDHYEFIINDNDFEKNFQKCLAIVEEPLGTTSIIPMYFLNEMVSKYLKVVLTGQGADEPLGGYNRYLGHLYQSKLPKLFWRLIRPFAKYLHNESIIRGLESFGETDLCKRFELMYSIFSKEEIKRLINIESNKAYESISYFYSLLEGKNKCPANAMMSNDLRMNLSDDLLLYTDKISMNFSIEARVPILDYELIDFIESLPLEFKIKGSEGKFIHKKFAEKVLPPKITYRKKKGFKSPTEKWFKGSKGLMYKELLSSLNSKFSLFFDINEVKKVFDVHLSGKRNMEKQLFILISLFYWLNENG